MELLCNTINTISYNSAIPPGFKSLKGWNSYRKCWVSVSFNPEGGEIYFKRISLVEYGRITNSWKNAGSGLQIPNSGDSWDI